MPPAAVSRSRRLQALLAGLRRSLLRLRDGLRVFRQPRRAALATAAQLGAWALQWLSCWLLLMALGLDVARGRRRRRRRAVRRQRHRRGPRHARQRRRLPGRVRGGARRRLPRLHPRRDRLRHRAAGRRGRHRADHGPARAAQRGPLLARRAPAHDARHARSARAAAAGRRRAARGAEQLRQPRQASARGGVSSGMADAWVYMLRCADGSLYTGWSTDVARRLDRHRAGKASRYTASRLPVELVLRRRWPTARPRGARRRGSKRCSGARSSR